MRDETTAYHSGIAYSAIEGYAGMTAFTVPVIVRTVQVITLPLVLENEMLTVCCSG